MALMGIYGIANAYTPWNQAEYTVNSSSTDGAYQLYQGTYVYTDSISVSSAPTVSYNPRVTIHGWNGNIDCYGVLFSTTQTNFIIGVTTPTASRVGETFWDNKKGELCVSTGTANCYSYGKFSLTAP